MPPAAVRAVHNPNPDRARRPRPSERATRGESSEEEEEPPSPRARRTSGAADGVEVEAANEQTSDEDSDADKPSATSRSTGLNMLVPSYKPSSLKRRYGTSHPVWLLVRKVSGGKLQCLLCDAVFSGGATRAAEHILGPSHPQTALDPMSSQALALKRLKTRVAENEQKKQRKANQTDVNEAAAAKECVMDLVSTPPKYSSADVEMESSSLRRSPRQLNKTSTSTSIKAVVGGQRTIEHTLQVASTKDVDHAIGRFFFACNVPAACVEHPEFKNLIKKLQCSPANYVPPHRRALLGPVLQDVVHDLRVEEHLIREAVLRWGGTACSDGWDTIERDHLVNLLVGTFQGMFFDGTVQLESHDHEDAKTVAGMLIKFINRTGKMAVVNLCTDTCSVMKSAWKLVCEAFPWISVTCCGAHVINLELKDIGKVAEVADVISRVGSVLNVFWGRKRWARRKLRELVKKNRGKEFGLYRAKQTRFAGKYIEMSRLLRVKAELQAIAVSPAYNKMVLASTRTVSRGASSNNDDATDALPADAYVTAKDIVLDDKGFWADLVIVLRVVLPLIKLLRLFDGNKPMLGKVYDRMFVVSQKLTKVKGVGWIDKVQRIHADRWEYLHSDLHSAAYALDPEFMDTVGELDSATQTSLMRVFERLALRDAIMSSADPEAAAQQLNFDSDEVVSRVAQVEIDFAKFQGKEGIFTKQSVILNAKKMAPSVWWRTYGKHLPLLCQFATTILAQVGAASACERNWSVYGRIRERRSQLGHSKADGLVYAHESMAMHAKLQSASYEMEVEGWDMEDDDDSQASDTEDLTVDLSEEEFVELAR